MAAAFLSSKRRGNCENLGVHVKYFILRPLYNRVGNNENTKVLDQALDFCSNPKVTLSHTVNTLLQAGLTQTFLHSFCGFTFKRVCYQALYFNLGEISRMQNSIQVNLKYDAKW